MVGSWRVHLGVMRLVQPVWPMAGANRWHALEVGVACALQCHKWHGDGGPAPLA